MEENYKILALGDSYTIGESVLENQGWLNQLADSLHNIGYLIEKPRIIARTGWTSGELTEAVDREKISGKYNFVFLLIGVNNQYRGSSLSGYKKEFEKLLKKAIHFSNEKPSNVFVLSIPDWGYTPFAEGRNREKISEEIDNFNEVNKNISLENKVNYIDVTEISRRGLKEKELIAGDGLHPSGKMYVLWVEKILPEILAKVRGDK